VNGLGCFENGFGCVEVKSEGARIKFDRDSAAGAEASVERTYWFERAFTKEQFAELAAALKLAPPTPLVADLIEDFSYRAQHGHDLA
jgi:hypothetical protein